MDLIIKDLRRYMLKSLKIRKLKNTKSNQDKQTSSNDILSNIFEGYYNHRMNIELRLNFIKYLFPILNEFYEKDVFFHITNLWDIFFDMNYYSYCLNNNFEENLNLKESDITMQIEKNFDIVNINENFNLTEDEQGLFLNIFNNDSNGSFSKFSQITGNHLFKNILTNEKKLNTKMINLNTFKVFQKFFYFVNIAADNKLFNIRNKYFVRDHDLIGQDFIWEILVNTQNSDVQSEATNLIVENSLNLIKFSSDFSNKIWSNFISKLLLHFSICMEKFNNLNNENKVRNNEEENNKITGLKGLLLLIKKLLEKIESKYIPSQDEVFFNDIGYEVLFKITNKNLNKVLKLDKNELIYDVRSKISYIFDIPLINVGFKSLRKNYIISCNDDATLAFELIDRNSTLEILILPNPITKINENPKNLILENKLIFDSLFQILKNPEYEFVNDAWELIKLMPSDKDLEMKIYDLGNKLLKDDEIEKNFIECFDVDSLYHLSYSIQILKKIINQENILRWIEVFIKNNAIHFFIKIIINLKQNTQRKANEYDLDMDKPTFSEFYLNTVYEIIDAMERLNDFRNQKQAIQKIKSVSTSVDFSKSKKSENFISTSKSSSTPEKLINNKDKAASLFMRDTEDKNDYSEIQDLFIQNLFRIIYEILIASYHTDVIKKYKEMQHEYLKKKTKELMMKNFNNKTDESIDYLHPDMEHIHEEIRKMWELEDRIITKICQFLENKTNFTSEKILYNILNYNNNSDISMKIESHCLTKLEDKENISENSFSLILKKGLIIPKNFKAKLSIWKFVKKLIISNNQESNKDIFFCYIYSNVFSKETLLYCINHSESLHSFSKIVMNILSYNIISPEFMEKNKNNLKFDFKETIDYILSLIENLEKFKNGRKNINSQTYEGKIHYNPFDYLLIRFGK